MKIMTIIVGLATAIFSQSLFAQSAGCKSNYELTQSQRWQLKGGIPWGQVWPPIGDDPIVYVDRSTCYLSLDFQINQPMPNIEGTVFYDGSTAWCQSVVNRQLVQQCGIL